MDRILSFRQKGFLMLLVLSFALMAWGCGRKAPPLTPKFTFSTPMEFHETAFGDNGNYLKPKPFTAELAEAAESNWIERLEFGS